MNLLSVRPFGARLVATVIAIIALTGAVTVAASAHGGAGDKEAVAIDGGATLLTVDPGTLEALSGAGFAVEPIEPAQVSEPPAAVTFAFPIAWVSLAASDLSGKSSIEAG